MHTSIPTPARRALASRSGWLATGALALALAGNASAGSIGLKLGINGNGGLQSAATGALLPTDQAGASPYTQANWNVLGRWGDSSGNTLFTVLDSDGNPTPVIVNWDANNIWSQAGGGTPTAQGTPDGNLMNSYDDSNGAANVAVANTVYGNNVANKPLVYIAGLSAWLAAQGAAAYDVVIYSDGDAVSGRVGEYWLQNASGPTSGLTIGDDLTTHVFVCDRANFVSTLTFSGVPGTVQNGQLSQRGNFQGNYAVIPSVTSDSFLLRTAEFNSRAQINAIQIVPRATPLAAMIDPLAPAEVYAGKTATFRATAAGVVPMAYQWLKGATPLVNGGNVAGATSPTLTLTGVSAADVASYSLVISNAVGVITSTPAALSLATYVAGSFAQAVVTNQAYAYWRLNDNGDPLSNYAPALDAIGGFSGTYGNATYNGYYGIAGPRPAEFPGFESSNLALTSARNVNHSWITAPPLNLNTNTATFCAWIFPTAAQTANTAILTARGTGSDIFTFGYANNANNMIGYTWNALATTYNFASSLVPLTNAWSFIALVVKPDQAVLYLYNAAGQLSATNVLDHTNAAFAGLTLIGTDPSSTTTPQDRAFTGSIDEVAVWNRALSPTEVYNLYKRGLGLNALPPVISREPRSQAFYAGRTAKFNVVASGDQPLTYRWRKGGSNLTDGGRISGANTATLTVASLLESDAGNYDVVVQNLAGTATSATASLTVVASNSIPAAYQAKVLQANPLSYWRMDETTGTLANDYWGGVIATHDQVEVGVAGPRSPEFLGLETTNAAAGYNGISSATTSGLSLMNDRQAFTALGWFNAAGLLPARAGLFGQNDVLEFGFHGTAADLGVWTPRGAAYLPQSLITPGVWYLVAAIGNATSLNLYLVSTNGINQATTTVSTTNYGNSVYGFNIGGGGVLDTTGNFFTGQLDEVALFDRALTIGELSDLFGAALLGGALPPSIAQQPQSSTVYAGRTVQLHVSAVGTAPLQYQWRKGGANVSNGGNVTGADSDTLVLTGVTALNAGDYDLVVNNTAGRATSAVATVTVLTPTTGSYEAAILGLNPRAYYRLNEAVGPTAFDYYGGFNGTYTANAIPGVAGVQNPPFVGFESTNTGVQIQGTVAGSYVSAPFGANLNTNITICAWIYPSGPQAAWAGLVVDRGGAVGGLGYNDQQMLGYTWNNNNGNTYGFASGLVIPQDQWSFVAVTISPTEAVLFLGDQTGLRTATNAIAHASGAFGNTWRIGSDANTDPGRNFNGTMDEVAIFDTTLTVDQVAGLFASGAYVKLQVQKVGANIQVTWPQGILLQADELTGPWSTNSATSPYVTPASGARKFYRALIP